MLDGSTKGIKGHIRGIVYTMAKQDVVTVEKRTELVAKFKEFVHKRYEKELIKAANEETALNIDYDTMDKYKDGPQLCSLLVEEPDTFFDITREAMEQTVLPSAVSAVTEAQAVRVRVFNMPEDVNIRDLRAKHLNIFSSIEGIVRRASEVRPEITETIWECTECGDKLYQPVKIGFISRPFKCNCGNRIFKQTDRKLIDARWITVEEPFELTEGEKPSQVNVLLTEDLVSSEGRRLSDPGNRLKITGMLREIPKGKSSSAKLDFFIEGVHVEPKETGWERIEISKEDEAEIKKMSKDPKIYTKLVASLAPSLYGMNEIKESIVLQLFGGVPRRMKDNTKFRGDIHLLLVGDPASGKSQLLKLAPNIVPRGKYVSGKGTTAAGLTATVTKDELLGGWVLEAGAIVLANKGLLCMHPDTSIIVDNKIRTFGSLPSNGEKVICNGRIAEVEKMFHSVYSYKDFCVKLAQTELIGKRRYHGKMISILLDSGFKINLTPNHPLIDGNTLHWKRADKFIKNDHVIAPLKLPGFNDEIRIIDVLPEDWNVCLTKEQKNILKNLIISKYGILSDFNRRHSLSKNVFSGGLQPSIKDFKSVLNDLDIYDEWIDKVYRIGKSFAFIKSKTSKLTPELGYILGFIYGDGHVGKRNISIIQSTKHQAYIDKFIECWDKSFDNKLGIYKSKTRAKIKDRKVESECVNMHSANRLLMQLYNYFVGKDLKNILMLPDKVIEGFIAGCFDADGCLSIKGCMKNNRKYRIAHGEFLLSNNRQANLNFMMALRRLGVYSRLIKRNNVFIVRITGRNDIQLLRNSIIKHSKKIDKSIPKRKNIVSSIGDKLPDDVISEFCRNLIKNMNTSELNMSGLSSTVYCYKNKKYKPSREQLLKILDRVGPYIDDKTKERLSRLLKREVFLDKIKEIKRIDYEGDVFDMVIPDTHNFVANGIFCHNSVDEFEKMDQSDQVAMHEALEQGTVSIAKASIMAMLPAETSVLAGANPKFSRFDSYRSIAEQITIVDTLLSRFDLKFVLRDVPNAEQDKKVVEHILKAREGDYKEAEPVIDPTMIRKYIAYTKANCQPKLTPETGKTLKEFYLRTRKQAEGGNAPIPITLRQFEALMRLSEASAKIQLSDYVRKEDAQRAIRLMKYSLRQLGYDPETGAIDVDKSEGATSYSERSKLRRLLDIITELSAKKKEIPMKDLESAAKKEGIDDIDELIERLKKEGMLFEPSPGFIQKI